VQAFIGWWLAGFAGVGIATGDAQFGVAGGFGMYLLAVQLWPWAPCKTCNGNPRRSRDWADDTYWRLCSGCGGKGVRRRLLALRRD
jgi:hypothetical protein